MSPQVKEAAKRALISGGLALLVAVATAFQTDPTYGAIAGMILIFASRFGEGYYDHTRQQLGDVRPADVKDLH
jgi:hypothetical protein